MEGVTAERLAVTMADHLPISLGTLKVFDDWFGREMDNIHTLVGARAEGDRLILDFDEGETLTVDRPEGVDFRPGATSHRLTIQHAERVQWAWYFYGRPRAPENLYVEEHWVDGNDIRARSTADWYTPTFNPSMRAPAVEFV